VAPDQAATPTLRCLDVEVCHGERTLLNLAALSLAPGEVLALMGPNGAGKSTLLQAAALLQMPRSGEIWLAGERADRGTRRRLRRETAMVFQAPLLFDTSVLANAASGLRFRGLARREAERRAHLWLERFGVDHLAARHARSLSGGEAQRVSLARALATEPRLLLLDEPFSALDTPTRATLVPALATQLRATATTAIVVTHDVAEAIALADRIGILLAGRLVQIGSVDEVIARPDSAAVAAVLGLGADLLRQKGQTPVADTARRLPRLTCDRDLPSR